MMRILLADDHQLVRAGVRPFLEELAPSVEIIEVESYQQAFEAIENKPQPDLVILDLKMPGGGEGALQAFCSRFTEIPTVILSGSTVPEDVLQTFRLGVQGYIPKTYSGPALLQALRFIMTGERFFPAFVLGAFKYEDNALPTLGSIPPRPQGESTQESALLLKLSARERDILGLMIQGGTNKEIARDLQVQEITVKVHLRNIYRKLGAANRAQAVRIALEGGWKSTPQKGTAKS